MLTRIRIEVSDESSAQDVEQHLDRYEWALRNAEVERFLPGGGDVEVDKFLGREITDEVIELEEPGRYRGRRVVKYERLDTRGVANSSFTGAGAGFSVRNIPGS